MNDLALPTCNFVDCSDRVLITGVDFGQLGDDIRDLVAQGDKANEDAETFYRQAGTHLQYLKEFFKDNPQGRSWTVLVKEFTGLSRSRADELIRIADGRTTLAKVRTKAREGMQKVRDSRHNVTAADNVVQLRPAAAPEDDAATVPDHEPAAEPSRYRTVRDLTPTFRAILEQCRMSDAEVERAFKLAMKTDAPSRRADPAIASRVY